MIPVAIGVTIIVFFMIHLVPGDPARTMLGVHATAGAVALLHHQWGLDRSLPAQYGLFMDGCSRHLGYSLFYRVSARALILDRLPVTLWLIGYATLLSVLITVPLAVLAASRKDAARDHAVRAVPLVGLGLPPFWLGIMLMLVFALHLGRLFPVGGYGTGFVGHLHSMFLPALTVALGDLADPDPQPARRACSSARVRLRHDRPLEGPLRAPRADRATRCATR